jgi:predicted alpha/beta superfamily hydrolase
MADWKDYPAALNPHHHGVVGSIKQLERVYSPQLDNSRDVLVYLPPSYDSSDQRYPVLYMHDGQNLFDPATSFAGEWEVDQTLESASQHGVEAIVVAISNTGAERTNEYSPFLDSAHGGGKGELYLRFIVETLKPMMDRDFRTHPGRSETGIAGSSMGGLISLYGQLVHGDTFGLAGVVSPSVRWKRYAIVRLIATHGVPMPARIHLDMGGLEWRGGLDDARRVRDALVDGGMSLGRDLNYVEERYAAHNEPAWARRLPGALRFLLGSGEGSR